MNKKAKIYILAEYHPTNLTELSFLSAFMLEKEIKSLIDELIERLYKERDADMNLLKLLEENVDKMIESVNMLLYAHEIRKKEIEYLEKITHIHDKKTVIYVEGNRETNTARPEIVELARKKNLKLVYLDEGNMRYEKLEDEKGRVLKRVHEIQVGREDFWVNRIEETVGDVNYAIAVVGVNHVNGNRKDYIRRIYRRISPKYRNMGYFDKKLKEREYEVEIFDITCK